MVFIIWNAVGAQFPWLGFPLLGWGILLAVHGVYAFVMKTPEEIMIERAARAAQRREMGRRGRGMDDGDKGDDRKLRERNYPDIVAAGSLAAVLSDAMVRQGSPLSIGGELFDVESPSFASCWHGDRGIEMYLALDERLFTMGLWENDIEVGSAETPDIDQVARTIRRWLEDHVRLSAVPTKLPHGRLSEEGTSYARGTCLEDEWQELIERTATSRHSELFHWDDLASFIRLASEHPELRRFRPFTSLNRFSVSPKAGPPDTTIPVVFPLGGGRFALGPYAGLAFGGSVLGDAGVIAEELATHLRGHGIEPKDIKPNRGP